VSETSGQQQEQGQGASVETAGGKPAAAAQLAAGEYVEVFVRPEDMQATAQALLDAAGEDVEAVQTVSGGFWVPEPVATAAGIVATDDRSVDPERTGDLEAREGSGTVVSADQVIAEAIASGEVSPQAVGAVFASNSPTGQDQTEAGQQELPAQPDQTEQPEQSEPGQVEEQETPAETGQQEEESAGEAETRSAPTAKSRRRASEPRATGGDGR
jgi:hypothetical protein